MGKIEERIKKTIIESLMLDTSPEELGDEDNLNEKLGIDSVGFLEILTAIEEEFDITLDDSSISRQSSGTVREFAEIINQKISE